MAKKGTVKARSVDQENRVAALYDGVRSESSGASDTDPGDVRTPDSLIECKYTGGPEHDRKRIAKGNALKRSTLLKHMEKVALEAWQEGREPAVALREYAPESKLAGSDGWVDLTVRVQHEDVHRARVYAEARASEALL